MSKRVMVFGTFDGLHKGHRNFFAQAKEYGERLVVIVARDATVEEVKKRRPRQNEEERLTAIQKEARVHEAYLGHREEKYKVITLYKPDVICLGYDQQAFTEKLVSWIQEHYRPTTLIRLQPYQPHRYKSSLLKTHSS